MNTIRSRRRVRSGRPFTCRAIKTAHTSTPSALNAGRQAASAGGTPVAILAAAAPTKPAVTVSARRPGPAFSAKARLTPSASHTGATGRPWANQRDSRAAAQTQKAAAPRLRARCRKGE